MITVVTAPEHVQIPNDAIKIFLAGGIQKCGDWQKELISLFQKSNISENIYRQKTLKTLKRMLPFQGLA